MMSGIRQKGHRAERQNMMDVAFLEDQRTERNVCMGGIDKNLHERVPKIEKRKEKGKNITLNTKKQHSNSKKLT